MGPLPFGQAPKLPLYAPPSLWDSPKLRFIRPLLFGGIPKLRLGVLTFNPLRGLTFNAIWEPKAALGDLTFNPFGVGKDATLEGFNVTSAPCNGAVVASSREQP
jgi:hypothetical protein